MLQTYSRFLFSDLENDHYYILKWLAKNGPQNLTELGGFRRWSKKRRLDGSKRFLGLIPNQFVRAISINNKETKYDLTMKGLIAVLAEKRFENIHIVKTYKQFLTRKIKKARLVNWSLDFVKYEIALIVSYHYLQGLDWTRFKFVREYWDDFKESDAMATQFIVDPIFVKQNYVTKEYDYVVHEYLKLFMILNLCTISISLGEQDIPDVFANDLTGRKFIHLWYHYLNLDTSEKSLKERQQSRTIKKNVLKPYREYLESIKKEAIEIVLKNGYDVSNRD